MMQQKLSIKSLAVRNACERIFLLIVMSLCFAVLQLQGCAYSQKDVAQFWREVAREYPGHHKMPRIIRLDDGSLGGVYYPSTNTVVIDTYAAESVWKHEFRHACGDTEGETGCRFAKPHSLSAIPECVDDDSPRVHYVYSTE